MLTFFRIIIPILAMGVVLGARAQSAKSNAPATSTDQQWNQLIKGGADAHHAVASAVGVQTVTIPTDGSSATTPIVEDYLSRANDFQDFLTKNPSDTHCAEARRLETLMLLRAGFYGDNSQAKRLNQLVTQVRQDATLPAVDRYAIAAFADNSAVPAGGSASQDVRLAQFEKIARGHIQEFGNLPQAFEALLHVAQSCDDAGAVRIANDLLAMPSPSDVQDGARTLLARHKLIGTSLATLLGGVLDAKQLGQLPNGQMVVIYSWAFSIPGGLGLANALSNFGPPHCTLIGANLDPDPDAAQTQVKSLQLKGILLFGKTASAFSDQLKLAELPIILTTDQKGVIRSVSATLPVETVSAGSAK
jgi:hypothetical protein